MLQKNTNLFTPFKLSDMPSFMYRSRFIIAIGFAFLLLLSSCKKNPISAANRSLLEQYFEDNILNKDFIVQLATDTANDLTPQYNGYTFKLLKNTLLDGPMTAVKGTTTYTGTWSCNDDYSKLIITLPNTVPVFIFLNREWRFTKKAVPLMELAPWGTTDPKVLHMQRL
jgi:hypothetical protein